jgi:hypothetical protein
MGSSAIRVRNITALIELRARLPAKTGLCAGKQAKGGYAAAIGEDRCMKPPIFAAGCISGIDGHDPVAVHDYTQDVMIKEH